MDGRWKYRLRAPAQVSDGFGITEQNDEEQPQHSSFYLCFVKFLKTKRIEEFVLN